MKTNYLYIAGLMAGICCFNSCTNEINLLPDSEGQNVITEFVATNETGSRTILTNNNAVQWKGFENISIMNGIQNCKFSNITKIQNANAVFTGEISATTGTDIYALYPYDSKASLSGNSITTTLKADQTAVANTFENGANISVAKATAENTLAFKNVCGLIKFTVDKTVNSITLTSENAIAGAMTISMADDENNITTTIANSEQKSITLSGTTMDANTAYYMVVPAITYTNPTIKLDENTTVHISGLISISRGQIISVSIKGQEAAIETPTNFTEYTITSITELAPEDGKDVIQLDFTSGPEFALQGVEQIKRNFKVNVTNTNGITVNNEYAVENIRLSNDNKSVILTLNKPVYTDDKISVSFNESVTEGEGENVGGLTSGDNGVILKTDDGATFTGYKNIVYDLQFTTTSASDYFTGKLNNDFSEYYSINTTDNSITITMNNNVSGELCTSKTTFKRLNDAKYSFISTVSKSEDNTYTDNLIYRLCYGTADIFRAEINFSNITTTPTEFTKDIILLNNQYYNQANPSQAGTGNGDFGAFRIHLNKANATDTDATFTIKDVKIIEEALRPGREYQQTSDNGTYQPGLITPDGDATTTTEE